MKYNGLFGFFRGFDYLNWWLWLQDISIKIFLYLNNYSEVKNWIILLMGISTLIIILFIIYGIRNLIFQKNNKNYWEEYRKDNFYELEWHWTYNMFSDQPQEFYTLCPHCKFQLYPSDQYGRLNYQCQNCNTSFTPINTSYQNLEHRIILKIQHKLRTDTYKNNRP